MQESNSYGWKGRIKPHNHGSKESKSLALTTLNTSSYVYRAECHQCRLIKIRGKSMYFAVKESHFNGLIFE